MNISISFAIIIAATIIGSAIFLTKQSDTNQYGYIALSEVSYVTFLNGKLNQLCIINTDSCITRTDTSFEITPLNIHPALKAMARDKIAKERALDEALGNSQ